MQTVYSILTYAAEAMVLAAGAVAMIVAVSAML